MNYMILTNRLGPGGFAESPVHLAPFDADNSTVYRGKVNQGQGSESRIILITLLCSMQKIGLPARLTGGASEREVTGVGANVGSWGK